MHNGWIKIYRKFNQWEWKQNPYMVALFIHLLVNANHEPTEWKGIIIERGQLVVGRDTLSKETGITQQSLRTCLKRLKSTNELTIKSTNKYSIITLCNYYKYQTLKNEINQQINQQTNQQLTNNQPTTNHKQEVKNIKKKRKNIGEVFQLPDDIDTETWNAFEEMRIAIRKPLTSRARKNIIISLDKIGQDKNEVLNQSITNCWRDVFKLRENNNGTGAVAPKAKEKWEQILDGEITTW